MALKWFFSLLILLPTLLYSQQKEEFKTKGVSVDAYSFGLFPYDFEIPSEHDEIFETNEKSKIIGTSIFLNYYVSQSFAFRIGSGYESINQPKINYSPVFLGVKWVLNDTKESLFTSLDLGNHFGEVDKPGFALRLGVGYRFILFKRILGTFELCYSHQNIYKTFVNSAGKNIDYHNIESAGFRLGIEIY